MLSTGCYTPSPKMWSFHCRKMPGCNLISLLTGSCTPFIIIEMVTLPSSPRPSSAASPIDIETNTDYLKIAKRGGGHKG